MMPRCSTAKAKLAAGLACFAVHVTGIPALQAQTFPTQTVRIVVGAAVSSPSDVLSRILATEVQAAEKWTVVIENTPGATRGGIAVAKSDADGHTLFSTGLPISAAPALVAKMPFDILNDFRIPTPQELVARATALIPLLRANAAECEASRRVTDANVDAMKSAGLFNVCKPKAFGGYEMGWDVLCEIAMALGKGCGSSGWLFGVFAEHNHTVATYPLQAQQDI